MTLCVKGEKKVTKAQGISLKIMHSSLLQMVSFLIPPLKFKGVIQTNGQAFNAG